MESPEDDAGIATSASRRESAREKDVGKTEEVDATSSYDQDSTEARTSCQTPAMSEDNFDGDSVPSPSTQDVNTSTEAILDMIDEIVDGPGAPKRLPLVSDFVDLQSDQSSSTSVCPPQEPTKLIGEISQPSLQIAVYEDSDNSKDICTSKTEVQAECSTSVEASDIVNVSSDYSNQVSVSVSECTKTVQNLQSDSHDSVSSVVTETSATYSNIQSSSALQNISESSDCEKFERTVKCVTFSETRDCVTVEKAESTSSDCCVSEGQFPVTEKSTKSPLRRRLVRPLPIDRRPDSTVSSTVDSQTVNICTTVQISENVTKDVSSSSDALPAVHGNIKSDEIRNVSEVSICKAETSMSSKKIKLIRPKLMITEGNNDSIIDNQILTSEQQHCQSTSTDTVLTVTNPSAESSNNVISTSKNCVSQVKPAIKTEMSEQQDKQVSGETNKKEQTVHTSLSVPNTSSFIETLVHKHKSDITQESNISELTSESSINSQTRDTKQNISVHCEKDDIKKSITLSKLTDSELNRNNSILNIDSIKTTEIILPDVELKNTEVKRDRCVSSSTISTHDMIIKDQQVEEHLEKPDKLHQEDESKIPPIKVNLSSLLEPSTSAIVSIEESSKIECDLIKQVPKLTIKLSGMQPEEVKSPTPKLTIKPLKPPTDEERSDKTESGHQIPCVAKLNIKPILKPPDSCDEIPNKLQTDIDNTNAVIEPMPRVKLNMKQIQKPQENLSEIPIRCHTEDEENCKLIIKEHIPSITKLNIKPIIKPPEKINDVHRKSSSSEISESDSSENDETTSTSDQTSVSDQGSSDVVPKVTIKLGKPGTESEGKFYTEQNIPKLTIKGLQNTENEDLESNSKLKLVISQHDNKQVEKVPKLTIKTLSKSEHQPLSPKLTIKPIRPPENVFKEIEPSKMKSCTETVCGSPEIKENIHVPKITIKSIMKSDFDPGSKTPKKSTVIGDNAEHIPFVTKLNIKPILKPTDNEETSEIDDKVPVVSKLNIKPVIRPKDNEIDSSLEGVPKITKLNIKPIKCPEVNSSDQKDCDGMKTDIDKSSIPVITKINIKPIVKPGEDVSKYSENQSSETSNSSDDNADHIPVITKLNIKPILKPTDESIIQNLSQEQTIPNITKLNIKPLIKPDDISSPSSPKKEHSKNVDLRSSCIPVVTKLNIKPIVKLEEAEVKKSNDELEEKHSKNPPLLMKINIKAVGETINKDSFSQEDHKYNNLDEYTSGNNHSKINKSSGYAELSSTASVSVSQSECQNTVTFSISDSTIKQNCISGNSEHHVNEENMSGIQVETSVTEDNQTNTILNTPVHERVKKTDMSEISEKQDDCCPQKKDTNIVKVQNPDGTEFLSHKPKVAALQNCTLLKKLLENTKDHLIKKVEESRINMSNCLLNQEAMISHKDMKTFYESKESGDLLVKKVNPEKTAECEDLTIRSTNVINDMCSVNNPHAIHNIHEVANSDSLTKPLEINISEKLTNQSSGLDSPRIILKINKTDHGPSAKIITEEIKRPDTPQEIYSENTQENINDHESQKKHNVNSRRKVLSQDSLSVTVGKRLRSSRIVENIEKSPNARRNICKRPSTTETSPTQNKETELSILETKRLKLGQLLSVNKSLTLTPVVTRITQTSPTKTNIEHKHGSKPVNHSILNNENCSKNGNSKLHNILSNLQAKQKQSLPFQDINHVEVTSITTENRTHSSLSDSNVPEILPKENCHMKVQEMLINENSDFRDLGTIPDDTSQDPLEVDTSKEVTIVLNESAVVIPQHVELTPQPKKRGRPRKIPLTDSPKSTAIILPVTALEERPQRSLRLTRDRPTILRKPRGRGRGRGARRAASPFVKSVIDLTATSESDDRTGTPIDPTCSRIKLPRMTEALDNMPGGCSTPLTSRRRSSSITYSDRELKNEADSSKLEDVFLKSPEVSVRGRGGRGSRGGRGRTPRGRGRGRGGGRGAVYMKETLGIYGRVCGPATTTIQLFEEETCMMDDNATHAKPSNLMDEDSQGSVKSSTNESNKIKKSKFADLFDSNKVWTAADVKEYTWPTEEKPDAVPQIMMIQEQVAMFLGVKSFKRRYPELKRRPIVGEEKDYVLVKGLVTEALCDLGITAVDASEVLDIMLSDYPHKYEEYRSHQRERQLTEPAVEETKAEVKPEEKPVRVEVKVERLVDVKPEIPKIDPEKVRQETAAAAIASASEWNARVNALRRTACVDLQTLTIHRRRAATQPARTHVRPPAGFYPHALLPGQYQHAYRVYTPEQLRFFPLNTVVAAPPAPPSPADTSSDSEQEWGSRSSSTDESDSHVHASKRKKLSKVKRSSQAESKEKVEKAGGGVGVSGGGGDDVSAEATASEDTCRTCKLRLEGNRKYTHERFLVCASCNAKLHPSCVELSADTIRKCREYAWQCAECKTCCACRLPADDDKMLFCDLCDRGFHIYCVGLAAVPTGRWHCVECAICKSCGARDPAGLGATAGTATPGTATPGTATPGTSGGAEWHHQTRRGPGGHKVYSHSLCTPCARAYRIGRYCPLCERSFIGPKGTMQLVICKLCDRQLHQECVRQTVSTLKVLDYTCAECRRGGITSRAAAVRLAPRTIATLFMAKRRFNKYAHRQYLASRMANSADANDSADPPDPALDCAG